MNRIIVTFIDYYLRKHDYEITYCRYGQRRVIRLFTKGYYDFLLGK